MAKTRPEKIDPFQPKAAPSAPPETVEQKLARLYLLQEKAQRAKAVYEQIDQLVVELSTEKLPESVVVKGKPRPVVLVDNYSGRNTVFRACGIKRFEIHFESKAKK